MVDWRSAHVGSARLGVSRSIEGYARKLEGEVNVQHPARIWVERQENKSVVNEPERLPTTSECGHHLLQIVKGLKNRGQEQQLRGPVGGPLTPAGTRNRCVEA